MATFSVNQVRQIFVVKAYKASAVTSADAVGTVSVHSNGEDAYFLYRGVDGVMRSDLIKKTNFLYGKATPAAKMARGLKKYTVALNSTVSATPVAGQEYLLRIVFKQHIGLSIEDQYFKYGVAYATSGMTAEGLYLKLIESLEHNFSREITPLLNFSLNGVKASVDLTSNVGVTVTAVNTGTAANSYTFAISSVSAATAGITVTNGAIAVSLTAAAKTVAHLQALIAADPVVSQMITVSGTGSTVLVTEVARTLADGTATGIVIEEVEQPWVLGRMESMPLNFAIQPATITVSGSELVWGTVTSVSATTTVENGKLMADLEYFGAGERGDVYRNVGFPNVINTTYLVDSAKKYNTLDLHYFYAGANEAVQKSEKDITLILLSDGSTLSDQVAMSNNVIAAVNTALGVSLATLPTS